MIFNADRVKTLIADYLYTGDQNKLEQILKESLPLIQAQVAAAGFEFSNQGDDIVMTGGITGDDVIQNCLIKISKAIPRYNPHKASPYNYMTTIIRNCINDALVIVMRNGNDTVLLEETVRERDRDEPLDERLLANLLAWNRARFPSIPANKLDPATEYILITLLNSPYSMLKTKTIILKYVVDKHGIKREMANLLYQHVIIKLRIEKQHDAADVLLEAAENTILPDVLEVVGDDAFNKLLKIFSGMTIKIP